MIVLALFNFQTYEGFKHVRGADLWVCLLVCVGVLACDGKEAKTCGSAFGWGTRTPCAMAPCESKAAAATEKQCGKTPHLCAHLCVGVSFHR